MKGLSLTQPPKTMPPDVVIQRGLELGLYRALPDSGVVIGKKGQPLKPHPDRDGYLQVTFVVEGVQRTVHVHRVMAVAVWGVDAIRGRQVGHRDGNPGHNVIGNLWIPASQKEHYAHDNAVSPKPLPKNPPKSEWPPCVRCGDPDGPPYYGRKTPARVTGRQFGIDGDLCWRCYRALHERRRRALKQGVA